MGMQVQVVNSNMWNEIHTQHETVSHAIAENKSKLAEIAKQVRERKINHVVLVGRGSSEHALRYAQYFLNIECGMFADIFNPSVLTCYKAELDFSKSLVIGVSQCGEAKDVYTILKEAEQQGAVVVSMTNTNPCLMSGVGEYVYMACGKELSYTAAKSYLTQAALLIELSALIAQKTDLCKAIESCATLIQNSYQMEEKLREALPLFRNVSDIMILGRGYSYAVALEAELKIQEASYTSGRAYASSDYQHGPISTTPRFTPFIVFLTDEKTDQSTAELVQRLQKEHQISTLVVTNKKQYETLGDYTILLSEKNEGCLSLFALAVFSQMFACLLSFARGYHPDQPNGLSKVTVTY